jgi:hypothetical protein
LINKYIPLDTAPGLPTIKVLLNIETDEPNAPFSIL